MKEIPLDVGLTPSVTKEAGEEKIERILEFIEEKRVTYPSEISGFLNIPKDTVYRFLRFLEGEGKIERLTLEGKRFVPEWLKPRLPELWKRNIKGDSVRRISFYQVVSDDGKSKKDPSKLK